MTARNARLVPCFNMMKSAAEGINTIRYQHNDISENLANSFMVIFFFLDNNQTADLLITNVIKSMAAIIRNELINSSLGSGLIISFMCSRGIASNCSGAGIMRIILSTYPAHLFIMKTAKRKNNVSIAIISIDL